MSGFNPQVLAQFSMERLLNSTVEGTAIALFAWMLLRFVGKQNSGTRFAVWFSALLSIAALPLVERLGASPAGLASRANISLPASWASYLFATWAFVAAVGLARVSLGLWQLRRLRKNCVPLPSSDLDASLQQTLLQFGPPRAVTLCVSDHLSMPTAIGFLRPLVVIPAWAMKELSTAELNSILLHELSHLRRWDDCTNLAQKVLGALLFFHPAVWWIEGRLTLEREMACDDMVLARTESPTAYAECLVSLAEKGFLRRGLALAQAAVSRARHTSLRVAQILDRKRPQATRVWMPALVLLGGFAFTAIVATAYLPRLVSFAGAEPATPAAQTTSGNAIDLGRANVVPVKLTTTSQAAPRILSPARVKHPRGTPVVLAKTVVRPRPLLLTQVRSTPEFAPQTVFVVMQTQQFTGPDSTVWTVCVWRVTWITPAQRSGIVARST